MKTWIWLIVTLFLILLVLGGAGWLILPRVFSEDAATSWVYHSAKYDYSLTLPSRDWQEVKKPDKDAAFYNRKKSVLVGVTVAKGDEKAFHKSVQQMKEYLANSKEELLTEPEFTTGTTEAGDPYAYWTVQAKVKEEGEAAFVANALVWCKKKDLVVSLVIEGVVNMRSQVGKQSQIDYYQRTAKSISLSVR
jgi:hypothetical protein